MANPMRTGMRRWQPGGSLLKAGFRPLYASRPPFKGSQEAAEDHQERQFRRSALASELEALLFTSPDPLSLRKIEELLSTRVNIPEVLASLANQLRRDDSAFELVEVAGGFKLMTRKSLVRWLSVHRQRNTPAELAEPLRDTLIVVAYRQPVTRAVVESVRGVPSADHLKQLLDLGLIRIAGREATLGRPVLYRTTKAFLEWCGLASLSDLPSLPAPQPDGSP
ncbi:MAG: SMC-Scp complex subunit ScpB [Planctomycetota bacterium]